jgi:uncharacterized membrane protein YkoI
MTLLKTSSAALAALLIMGSSFALAESAPKTTLQAQAKVAEADARTTALAKVPGGSVSSSELEKEHGKLVWSFDIAKPGTKDVTEIQVDAKTGKIVSEKVETAAQEQQESRAEKKPRG